MDYPDFEWLMINASYIKAHPHSTGARGGSQVIARKKEVEQQAAYSGGLPRHAGTTSGYRRHGCRLLPGLPLIEGTKVECLLADKARNTNEIIGALGELEIEPVIPPKSNQREKRNYDRAPYKLRHLVENRFLEFKQWLGVATRYAKRAAPYLAACHLRAVMIWSKLF